MNFNRRQFLKATLAASAASAFPSVWLRARQAQALEACEMGVNLVIVQLEGGNDGLNMVIPKTDGSGSNRSTYNTVRPYTGVPAAELAATQIGNDINGSGGELALHPHMIGLKQLYTSGNLAVLLGTHYNNPSTSHEVSESIWYRADPDQVGLGTGWMGRTLDSLCTAQPTAVPAVDTQSELTPLFYGNTSVMAFDRLSDLSFPLSENFDTQQTTDYRAAFAAIYNAAATGGANFLGNIGTTGAAAAAKVDSYRTANLGLALNLNDLINGTANGGGGFGVVGTDQNYSLASGLRTTFALMKGAQPGNTALGCRVFRVRIGGFDSHSQQGLHIPLSTKSLLQKIEDDQNFRDQEYHGRLMHRVSQALSAFWADCVADGTLYKNTVIMTFSEFGRRIEENGENDSDAGTDHGTAGPMFVIGPKAGQSLGPSALVGGVYGAHSDLNAPDGDGNMIHELDFRQMYGEIINNWLGLSTATTQTILGGYDYLTDPARADFLV